MSVDEDFTYSDDEIDEKKHQKLLDKVLSLNKAQQLKKSTRTEPTLKISEFDLVKGLSGKKGAVYIEDLTKVLEKRRAHVDIKTKVESAGKFSRTLPKPLEKPAAERIRRAVAYEKTRLELDRWEPIVTSNRVSTDQVFPLPESNRKDKDDKTKRWRLKTTFDLEMEKLNPTPVEEIHVDLEKEKFPMSMEEIKEYRKEAAKMRAKQSYKEAKARRQAKIKSKKYHRIQRKEQIKKQLKEFEQLQKTDPEEALRKLDEIEKIRAHERFSLRHKGTGKWAKNKQIRAKYDKESRQELAEQLRISKELTQKINTESDSEDDNIPQLEEVELNDTEKDNPWLSNPKVDKELKDFVRSYKKYWSEKMNGNEEVQDGVPEKHQENDVKENVTKNDDVKEKQKIKDAQHVSNDKNTKKVKDNKVKKVVSKTIKPKKSKTKSEKPLSTAEWLVETVNDEDIEAAFDKLEKNLGNQVQKKLKTIKNALEPKPKKKKNKKPKEQKQEPGSLLKLPIQKKRPIIDEALLENVEDKNGPDDNLDNLKKILEKKTDSPKSNPKDPNIDPNKFMNVKVTNLDAELPDLLTNADDDEEMVEDSNQRELIAEAFQDDDLVEEFKKEKADEVEKNKIKDINLTLPGWGSWGGTGIVPNKRKQKRFIVKAPKKMPRRDDNKGILIINEDADKKAKEHMVDELPFPFQRVKDFEASIRAPIGRTFVPETVYRKLTKQAVKTKIGAIIEPMDKDVLFKKSKS